MKIIYIECNIYKLIFETNLIQPFIWLTKKNVGTALTKGNPRSLSFRVKLLSSEHVKVKKVLFPVQKNLS